MLDDLINTIVNIATSVLNFIKSVFNWCLDFIKQIVLDIYELIKPLFEFLWGIFKWIEHETFVVLYNLLKDCMASVNLSFPATMPDQAVYWYHQINQFFPLSTCIDAAYILLNTFLIVLFIKLSLKIKLKIGGMITKPMFK